MKIKKIIISIGLFSASALSYSAAPVYQLSKSIPSGAGIVWVVVQPALVAPGDYRGSISINWGSYNKTITLPRKAGSGPYVIGFPHWKNDAGTMTVTSNGIKILLSTYKATISSVNQGNNPATTGSMELYCGYSTQINCQ